VIQCVYVIQDAEVLVAKQKRKTEGGPLEANAESRGSVKPEVNGIQKLWKGVFRA
jgi:hypothetical protein